MTRSIVVWGCTSGAGKSWLATALCRVAARRGVDVVPFKAQNMSNNARVVPGPDGLPGEIGAAQYFQARAAGVAPHTDMNPVLLKPERDTASQVVVNGRVDRALSRQGWRERSALLAQAAQAAFQRLAARHALVVIEGAGSPAEINLAPQDYVNLGTARWARDAGPCAALLVSDIDRGGSFAHGYGTWALLPPDLQPLLRGLVLNRFRGDPALLAPAPEQWQRLTGVPVAGVLPLVRDHGLPEEDGWFGAPPLPPGAPGSGVRVVVLAPPHLSNLDEFQPLRSVPGVQLAWARQPAELAGADWVVLPGSKQVSGDLAWLHAQGLAPAVQAHAARGGRVLGLCGGLQMLGEHLADPEGHDGEAYASGDGLGLLALGTTFGADKRLVDAPVRFGTLAAPWEGLSGLQVPGYEIRCGRTVARSPQAKPVLFDAAGQPIGWQQGPVLGVYAHGLFESPAWLQAVFGVPAPALDAAFERLADTVEAHVPAAMLAEWIGR